MTELSVGERFVNALAQKDPAALRSVLQDQVDFRGMTPARFWEADDPGTIVDKTILGTWFAPDREITEIVRVDSDIVGPLERCGYRLKVMRADGEYLVEQQAYLRVVEGRIGWLRIMCTGFLPLCEQET